MSHLPVLLAKAVAGQNDLALRGMWLAIILRVAKRQPPTTGPSVAIDGRPAAAAILYAGAVFGGTITVLLGIYYFLVT